MIGYLIGRRYKSINLILHYRPWWFGKWSRVRLEMGPMEVYWSPEVEEDVLHYLEMKREMTGDGGLRD